MTNFAEFVRIQALSCIFPITLLVLIALSKLWPSELLPRYDLLLLLCIGMQILMVRLKLETTKELLAICLFHVIGLAMELHKVRLGSWAYPADAYTKIGGVPLYSGFMYASVASYMCQAWRRFDLQVTGWPKSAVTATLAVSIYGNYFMNWWQGFRWYLFEAALFLFWHTRVFFSLHEKRYSMPLLLSLGYIGFFVWLAENLGTFWGGWQYPNQADGWEMVGLMKVSSWILLIIVSFVIIAFFKKDTGAIEEAC